MTVRTAAIRLLAIAALLAGCDGAAPPTGGQATYTSETYGYSFVYPDSLDVQEYTPEHVALGRRQVEDGFDAVVEAGVFTADGDSAVAFDDFVVDRARTLCAADGPRTSMRCTDVEQRTPFTTATGLTGEVFYLKHETVDIASGAIDSVSGRGPFFVFQLSANAPAAALIIRPPTNLAPDDVDSELVRQIANSIRIDRVEQRTATR